MGDIQYFKICIKGCRGGAIVFYISRKDRSGAWITDTTDGVSEYYYYYKIMDIVEMGIKVDGVDGNIFRVVSPYDNADVAKNVLLRGIEYHIGGHGELCYLSTVENFIGEPVRLSEFCTSVLGNAIWDNQELRDMSLIFDDKICSVDEDAFDSLCDCFVFCDVSEVIREDLRMQIYRAFVSQPCSSLKRAYHLVKDTDVKDFYFLEASILYAKTDLPPVYFSGAGADAEGRFLHRNKSRLMSIIRKAERIKSKRIVLDAGDYDFLTGMTSPSDMLGVSVLRNRVFWRNFGLRVLRNYFDAGGRDKDLVEMTFRAVIELTNKCTEVRA